MITIKDYIQFIEDLECVDIYDLILKNLAKGSSKFQNDFELDTVDGDIEDIKEIHKIYRKLIRRKETLDFYSDFIYNESSTVN
jgi:hypothetical protein